MPSSLGSMLGRSIVLPLLLGLDCWPVLLDYRASASGWVWWLTYGTPGCTVCSYYLGMVHDDFIHQWLGLVAWVLG